MEKQLILICLILSFVIYSGVIYTSGTTVNEPTSLLSEKAKRGKLLFHQHNCIACHQIYGLGGYMGPDLTNAISRTKHGAVVAEAFLKSGTQKMPNFHLQKEEIDALVAFLSYLDRTSNYPVTNYEITYLGTVEAKNN
jgi:nitric oxide reductase subunit C